MAVADTSYLVALQHADEAAQRIQERIEEEASPLRVPTLVWVEYTWGLTPSDRAGALASMQHALSFEPLDLALALHAVDLQDQCLAAGRRLAWTDLVVAATATRFREPLLTLDRSFDDVPGLEVMHP